MRPEIERLVESSAQVILGCSLGNGAIIAANSASPHYPPEAKCYSYVWPRDASFACIAADILGIGAVQENFFSWLSSRAEGWGEAGLFYEKYHPNGLQALGRFQPDQTGTVLFAVWHHFKEDPKRIGRHKPLVKRSADGICRAWEKDHFSLVTNDIWEERLCFPDLKENFAYSLGACIRGLLAANDMCPDKRYAAAASQMRSVLLKAAEARGVFFRSFGRLNDERPDASLLGLVWPFEVVSPGSPLAKSTVSLIEKRLARGFGVYRYEGDEYDGWMYQALHRKKGAGFWPVLNFWLAIVLARQGRKGRALKYYFNVVGNAGRFLPEQVFCNPLQKSVSPLA